MMRMVTKSKPMKAVRNTASSKLSAFRMDLTILTPRLKMLYTGLFGRTLTTVQRINPITRRTVQDRKSFRWFNSDWSSTSIDSNRPWGVLSKLESDRLRLKRPRCGKRPYITKVYFRWWWRWWWRSRWSRGWNFSRWRILILNSFWTSDI